MFQTREPHWVLQDVHTRKDRKPTQTEGTEASWESLHNIDRAPTVFQAPLYVPGRANTENKGLAITELIFWRAEAVNAKI